MALTTKPRGTTGMEITRVGFGAWAIGGATGRSPGVAGDAESVAHPVRR